VSGARTGATGAADTREAGGARTAAGSAARVNARAPRMSSQHALALATAALAVLWAVMVVHASGQSLLAVVLLAAGALALWTYGSPRAGAWRYLFPGIAAALVFVVFPMLFTVAIGFTNRSSTNLLDEERAREQLLQEAVPEDGSELAFTLHADASGGWRVAIAAADGADSAAAASVGVWLSPPLALAATDEGHTAAREVALTAVATAPPNALALKDVVPLVPALRVWALRAPDGQVYHLTRLREFSRMSALYEPAPDDASKATLVRRESGKRYRADARTGFFTAQDGERLEPGFKVNVGLAHFTRLFTETKFREPFIGVFVWTVMFSALSVLGAAALGLVLASLLAWDRLQGKAAYRLVLFLPYAVPGFLSILVFKGLFNQNLGEINFILNALFGIRPAWFSDPWLARSMLLVVNIWLGFPYMMVLCGGLVQSIPGDLREASSVAGAGPLTHFFRITLPLIAWPLTPLLIAAFAFNFNNFVLVSLLTGGRPDHAESTLPAGTTDILVSYTWRIAFQDSGQQYGLAAAISTVIFLLVAAITMLQMRLTAKDAAR
jgi:maltose/maltodextrin transport system permease protein